MRKTRLSAAVVLGVAAVMTPLAALAGPASAATSATNPNTPETVASGINVAHLPGATVFGTTPANTPETVSFILQERNIGSLKANVIKGVTKYLSVSQFASAYGQTPANIAALTSYLARFGIKTTVYADNVDVSATGTAGEFDAALSVTQNQYHVPAIPGTGGLTGIPAQTVHGNAQSPLLPYRLSNFVLAILGLTNYAPYASNTAHVNTSVVKPQQGNSNSCIALTGLPNACNLPSNFAANYNLNGLYNKGANGSGQTLAIVTLAAVDPGAPQYFWSNIAHVPHRAVHRREHRRRPGRAERRLGYRRDRPGPGAVRGAGARRQRDRLPGAQHRPRVRRLVLHRGQPEHRRHRVDELGRVGDHLEAAILAGQEAATYLRPSTRPSSSWPRRASPPSTPPVTRGLTTQAVTSAPPTCRSTRTRTART